MHALAASSVGIDFLSGLLGVGGGSITVPALHRATDLSMQTIVATPLAVITLVSVGGVATSATGGHVDWHIALPSAVSALTSMLVGRHPAQHLIGSALQQGFTAFAGVIALEVIIRTLI